MTDKREISSLAAGVFGGALVVASLAAGMVGSWLFSPPAPQPEAAAVPEAAPQPEAVVVPEAAVPASRGVRGVLRGALGEAADDLGDVAGDIVRAGVDEWLGPGRVDQLMDSGGDCEDAIQWGPDVPVGSLSDWPSPLLTRVHRALQACSTSGGFGGAGVLADTSRRVRAEMQKRELSQ